MKRNDNGGFCILYVEPNDDKAELVQVISGQKKPVVIMLAEQARVFQRPEDFTALKRVRRQLDQPIIFVIPSSGHLAQLASRNGFPVYLSMDALARVLAAGKLGDHRTASRGRATPLPIAHPSSPLPRALTVLAIFALVIASIGSFLVFYHKLPEIAATPVVTKVGRVTYLSSGQLSENSSQGISDEVLIELDHVSTPAPQKSYYVWLLGDKNQNDVGSHFLGALRVSNGKAQLRYPGDPKHTNLLLLTSRFLITEEEATVTPIGPSPDYSTWRYYGEISQEPIQGLENDPKHSSMLDHLRHLLASDPTLDEVELPGGLNNWLYRNSSKVLEWTISMREPWEDSKDSEFIRHQAIRILDYLDGATYVQQDLPPNTPLLVNGRLARIGLLEVNGPTQDPPGYLTHTVQHLNGLLQTPGATSVTRKLVAEIVTALNNAKYWLTQVRMDAKKIMQMNDAQLRQPSTLTLINNMIDNATHAYGGEIDPTSSQRREAINWVHDHMQFLAAFDISTFQSFQMIKDIKNVKAWCAC
jgi:hypothetical protein